MWRTNASLTVGVVSNRNHSIFFLLVVLHRISRRIIKSEVRRRISKERLNIAPTSSGHEPRCTEKSLLTNWNISCLGKCEDPQRLHNSSCQARRTNPFLPLVSYFHLAIRSGRQRGTDQWIQWRTLFACSANVLQRTMETPHCP